MNENNKLVLIIIFALFAPFLTAVVIFFTVYFITDIHMKQNEKKNKEEYDISYAIPKEFDKSSYGEFYNYGENDIYCTLDIQERKKEYYEKTLEEYLKDNITVTLNDKVNDIEEIKINNIKMLHLSVKKKYSLIDYYGIEGTEKYYMLEYKISDYKNGDRKDINDNLCYTAKDKILNSIKIKK